MSFFNRIPRTKEISTAGSIPTSCLFYASFDTDFEDESQNPLTLETNNNTVRSTNQVKVGTHSLYTDAATDYLKYSDVLNNGKLWVGTGEYTIEFWWYPTSTHGTWSFLVEQGGRGVPVLGYNWSVKKFSPNGGTNYIAPNTPISTGAWVHVAYDRVTSSPYARLYIDGVLQTDTFADTRDLTGNNNNFIIGNFYGLVTYGGTFYLDGIGIYNTALYKGSNFTPRTTPYT